MVRLLVLMVACSMSTIVMASYRQSGLFTQLSIETGLYKVIDGNETTSSLGFDLRLGTHSRAWRDFYRYVGIGTSFYNLDEPSFDVDSDDLETDQSNTYATVFAFGGIALNAPFSPFIELGLNGAQWLNGEYADEPNIGQNGFLKLGVDLKSRNGGWLQLFYKISSMKDVGPLDTMDTFGITAGLAF